MKNNDDLPSITSKTSANNEIPLFTCGLRFDRQEYEDKIQLERNFRKFVEGIRSKRSNLPPEAQNDLSVKSNPLEYYDSFSIDRQGDEITSLNVGALQLGWLIPEYEQVYRIALPDSEQHASLQRARRPKPCCFNCGAPDHGVQSCPIKLDGDRIRRSREQYQEQLAEACGYNDTPQAHGSGNGYDGTSRYHEDSYQSSLNDQVVIEERFRRFQPGSITNELREAMGLRPDQLPIYIYNMRRCGYPPGWLREARVKKSGLQVFHDNEEGEIIETKKSQPADPTGQDNVFPGSLLGETVQTQADLNIEDTYEYDYDKVISFPGFNIPVPEGVVDEAFISPNLLPFNKQQSKENLIEEMYLLKKPSLKRKSTLETYKPTPIEELTTNKHVKTSLPIGINSPTTTTDPISTTTSSYEQKSLGQVYGTPLWIFNNTPKLQIQQQLPSRDQFQQGICDHLPFENLPSYQPEKVGRIFDLLKDVQKRLDSLNNNETSGSKKEKSNDDNNMQMSPDHTEES